MCVRVQQCSSLSREREGGGVVGVTQQGNLLVIGASDSRAHAHTHPHAHGGQMPSSNTTDGAKLIISSYIMNITAGCGRRAEVTP